MARHRVFVTRGYHPEAVALLEQRFDVEVWRHNTSPPRDVILRKVTEVHGMFTEAFDVLDREVMRAATTLRVVANRAVGTDNLDIPEATRRGILLANTPGVLHESCAHMAFALMLGAARRVVYADRQVRAGAWTVLDQSPYLGLDVHGKTLGLVGMGRSLRRWPGGPGASTCGSFTSRAPAGTRRSGATASSGRASCRCF